MLTLVPCVFFGLEVGVLIGIGINFITLLYFSARPSVSTKIEQVCQEARIANRSILSAFVVFLLYGNLSDSAHDTRAGKFRDSLIRNCEF